MFFEKYQKQFAKITEIVRKLFFYEQRFWKITKIFYILNIKIVYKNKKK